MARYIDLEVLEKRIKKYVKPEIPEEKAFVEWCKDECIRQAYAMPTADVVPKSEVERLEEELSKANADVKNYMKVAEYQQSLSVKRYHEIKRLETEVETLKDTNEHLAVMLEEAKSKGRWKPYKDYFTHRQVGWICTNCSTVTHDLSNGDTEYCPCCGAMMEAMESEEEDEMQST